MSEFVPQNTIGNGFDYTTAGTQPGEKGVAPAQKNPIRLYDQKGDPPNIGRGEIVISDLSLQGLNHPEGDYSKTANGIMASNMWSAEPNSLTPPADLLVNAAPIVSGTVVGQHSAFAFNRLFTAAGAGANVSLWKETSATDSTPSPITWSPGASVCSLTASLTSGAERLVAGRIGAAAVRFSDATGTVGETMHADTNSMWGMILGGVNSTDAGVPVQIIYSGNTIKTKATNADQTTALVATVPPTSVNAGGFAVGMVKPAGRARRAYWGIPKVNNTSGALKYGAEALMTLMSTSEVGDDLLPHKSDYLPNGIYGAVPWRLGLVYWDDTTIVYWDGDTEWNLGIFGRRIGAGSETYSYNTLSTSIRRRIRSVLPLGPDLYVLTNPYTLPDGTNTTFYMMERYRYETGTWHPASPTFAGSAAGTGDSEPASFLCGQGGIGWSFNTRRAQIYETGNNGGGTPRGWFAYFIPRPGESMLWQNSQGPTSTVTTNIPIYTTGKTLLPNWRLDEVPPGSLPGTRTIKRAPKVITEVEFDGTLDYGGTSGWTFRLQCFGNGLMSPENVDQSTLLTAYDETFSQGQTNGDYVKRNRQIQKANITNMQWFLTATPSGSTRKIPQLLPFTIRFAYSKDGSPITSLPEDGP